MSAQAPTPRRRVRTGCLTCRGRRRKCDEARPVCENCKAKNLACRYGVNITFVASRSHHLAQAKSNASASGDQSTDFGNPVIDNTSTAVSNCSVSPASNPLIQPSRPPNDAVEINECCVGDLLPQPDYGQRQVHMLALNFVDDGTHRDIQRETSIPTQGSTRTGSSNPQYIGSITSPMTTGVVADVSLNTDQSQDLYELDLLHHYRYKIAPILDLGLRQGYYSVRVMLDAVESPCVYSAVLATSSCHRASSMCAHKDLDLRTSDLRTKEIVRVDCAMTSVEAAMLMTTTAIQTIITEPIQRWLENLHTRISHISKENVGLQTRLLLTRVILAALTVSPRKILPASLNWVLGSPLMISREDHSDHLQYQLHVTLSLLAQTLNFLAGAINEDSQRLDSWQSCWESLEAWYIDRPLDAQEIYQTSGDTDSVEDSGIFPFILFSNPRAIMVNAVHHLTAILLLQNKPRSRKLTTHSRISCSVVLHARRIIGIAQASTNLDFWDPLLAAAVIQAGKIFSHFAQREITAKILDTITETSGMRLGGPHW